MRISNRSELKEVFYEAANQNLQICIGLKISGIIGEELVISQPEDLSKKLSYYLTRFDENLNHKCGKAKIVSASVVFSMMLI